MDQFERDYVSERSAQNRPRDDSISLENLPPPSFVSFANYVQRPLAVFTGSLMDSSAGSTVGGTGWGQTIINSAVPGAYYAGQAELAFRDGRYLKESRTPTRIDAEQRASRAAAARYVGLSEPKAVR